MNNKGFAITTILYGTLILFCMLLVSMLGILSNYKHNLEMLIDSLNGTRDIVELKAISVDSFTNTETITKRGLYCVLAETKECKYISNSDIENGLSD